MAIIPNLNRVAGKHEVIVAPGAGFCHGVEVAVEKTLYIAKNRKSGHIFLDGELVHNREVGDQLRAQGVQLLEEHSEIYPEDTIIIRAHGVSPQRRFYLERLGCEVVDCTCPLVGRIAKIIEAHSGSPIILLGDRNHTEIEGLCGYSKNIHVCENLAELAQLIDTVQQKDRMGESILGDKYTNPGEMNTWILVCQSTLDMDFLEAAKNLCDKKNFPIEIFDTICGATKRRQLGLRRLESCDAAIVVGGKHSANTKRLYEKMKQKIMAVFWIENAKNLAEIDLSPYPKIGIASGTSTPQNILRKIYGEISKK
jgi:4-hydroxy-3-methylbut-2-enyl diphosphate reductase